MSDGSSDKTVQPQPPQNLGQPLGVILRTLLIFLFSQLIAVLVVGTLNNIYHHHPASLDSSISGQFFYILVAELLAGATAIWLVRRRHLGLSIIGLGRRPLPRDLWNAAVGFGVFIVILIIVSSIVSRLSPELNNQKQDLGFTDIRNSTENTLAFISLVILPPLGEETLVRGYLYSGLRKFWRFWPAVAVTSIIFGAAHLEFGTGGPLVWAAAIDTFLLSVVLCFLRERTGALYAGMLVHMLNNLIAFHFVIK